MCACVGVCACVCGPVGGSLHYNVRYVLSFIRTGPVIRLFRYLRERCETRLASYITIKSDVAARVPGSCLETSRLETL